MATAPTLIGPVGARQINRNFYAGLIDLTNIQKAVTAAVAAGGGRVVIPAGYAGSDAIAAVTGGSPAVYISDLRGTSPQAYAWSGTAYVPADFVQLGDMVVPNLVVQGSAQIADDLTVEGDTNIEGTLTAAAAEFNTCLVADSPVRTFDNTPDGPGEGMVWPPIGIPVSQGAAWQTPSIPVADVPRLSLPNTFAQPNIFTAITASGAIQGSGGLSVKGLCPNVASTVKLENDTTRGYMDVIGSDAATAGLVSIRGASLDGSVLYTYLQMQPTGIFTASGVPFNVQSGINASGIITAAAGAVRIGPRNPLTAWQSGTANINADSINLVMNPPNGTGSVYFGWDQGTGGVIFGNGAGAQAAAISSTGSGFFAGGLSVGKAATQASTQTAAYSLNLYNLNASIFSEITAMGDGGSRGIVDIGGVGGNALTYTQFARFSDSAITFYEPTTFTKNVGVVGQFIGALGVTSTGLSPLAPGSLSLSVSGNAGYLDSIGTGTANAAFLYLRVVSSNASIVHNSIVLDNNGNCAVLGVLTAGTKNFRITHPLDDTKDLTHSCLEGPDIAVYYRGEGMTVEGRAEVVLPDYFEALTMPEGRTVLLTALYEEEDELLGMLAASRVQDGKFRVRSSNPAQKFCWEVKAVRADVQPLIVTTQKEKINDGTERDGTTEAGEPATKDSYPATTASATGKRTRYVH